MSRVLLTALLLVCGGALTAAALPCKTQDEAFSEAVVSFFTVQRIAAGGCDRLLGETTFMAAHEAMVKSYAEQIAAADAARAGYLQRAHGDDWQARLALSNQALEDLLSASMVVSEEVCGKLGEALKRRHEGGWEPIRDRLERRVRNIAGHDANVCKE